MTTVPVPVVRSISRSSRPIASQWRMSAASASLTASSVPPTLFASPYFATSLSVTSRPLPPMRMGRCAWIGGGSLRTSFAA